VRQVVLRALKAKNSRHVIFRYRFNAIKASIVNDTFPKVMRLVFPYIHYDLNKTDWFVTLPNGSEIWFAGLDDKERAEKILGMEFVTIFFNEASQIPYQSIMLALTRLAQLVVQLIPGKNGKPDEEIEMVPRVFYDLNPTSKAHWSYRLFILKIDPDSKLALANPQNYTWMRINPKDNLANLTSTYMDTLNAMSARNKLRFLEGEFCETMANALFTYENIETYRHLKGELPDFVRVVVGVDPSGAADADSSADAIGIVVVALGVDGRAYVLEDCTVTAGPTVWGRVATTAFDRHQADCIVAERNFGGAMVEHVIQTSRPRTPCKMVTASRGKHIRAEPISALYEEGKVIHVGNFPELEEELTSFSTTGYMGDSSPNRCFIAGTLITTDKGDVPIEAIIPGVRVLTRQGFRKVLYSGMNDANAETITIEFSDGRTLTATPNHPVFVEGKGSVRVDTLVWGDTIVTPPTGEPSCQTQNKSNASPSYSTGLSIDATQHQPTKRHKDTTQPMRMVSAVRSLGNFIEKFGNQIMVKYLRVILFTTSTAIRITTSLRILSALHQDNMQQSIRKLLGIKSLLNLPVLGHLLNSGTLQMRAESGIVNMGLTRGLVESQLMMANVSSVGSTTYPLNKTLGFVQESAIWLGLQKTKNTMWIKSALFVTQFLKPESMTNNKPVPVFVVKLTANDLRQPVYNMAVDEHHEYFANGVLVSNCDALVWALAELFQGIVAPRKKKPEPFIPPFRVSVPGLGY
jgi:hypothetical protein